MLRYGRGAGPGWRGGGGGRPAPTAAGPDRWSGRGPRIRTDQLVFQAVQDMFQPFQPLSGGMTLSGEFTTWTTSPTMVWL
jgi:hypothetical protein